MMSPFRLENETLFFDDGSTLPLYSDEGFEFLSLLWLKVGWNARYHYSFSWMGLPALQLPEDLIRIQEIMVTKRPDVIIETGIGMGGSLLFYASVCQLLGRGRVIGIDIDLRPHNRPPLEAHPLITLVDGDSKTAEVVVAPEEQVMVILDANHSKAHVAGELEHFAPLVSVNQYLIVADGFKKELADVPRGKPEWEWDNPINAVDDFLMKHPEFVLAEPKPLFSKSKVKRVSHMEKGWLLKTSQSSPQAPL